MTTMASVEPIETVTVQRSRLPPWWLVLGFAALAIGGWLVLSKR